MFDVRFSSWRRFASYGFGSYALIPHGAGEVDGGLHHPMGGGWEASQAKGNREGRPNALSLACVHVWWTTADKQTKIVTRFSICDPRIPILGLSMLDVEW